MAFVNYSTREINVKIVYYGPGLSGKTANLQYLYSRAPQQTRGRLISLATETERTLFFDFLPMNLGTLRGFQVRFHLYTVPGQVFYEASRKLILKGVDGLLFIADSDPLRLDANAESWEGLHRNLAAYGLSAPPMPVVVQYNKRDVPGALPVPTLRQALGDPDLPEFEGVAVEGTGVFESLKALARGVLNQLQNETLRSDPSGFAAADRAAAEETPSRPVAPPSPPPVGGPAPVPPPISRPVSNPGGGPPGEARREAAAADSPASPRVSAPQPDLARAEPPPPGDPRPAGPANTGSQESAPTAAPPPIPASPAAAANEPRPTTRDLGSPAAARPIATPAPKPPEPKPAPKPKRRGFGWFRRFF